MDKEAVEKKKRFRPTVALVRELEGRIGTLEDEKSFLQTKYESQDKHYSYMAKELDRLRGECKRLEEENADLQRDRYFLLNRGFWSRLFNRH